MGRPPTRHELAEPTLNRSCLCSAMSPDPVIACLRGLRLRNGGQGNVRPDGRHFARRAPLSATERHGAEGVSDRVAQVLSSAAPIAPSCAPADEGCLVAPTVRPRGSVAVRPLAGACGRRPARRPHLPGTLPRRRPLSPRSAIVSPARLGRQDTRSPLDGTPASTTHSRSRAYAADRALWRRSTRAQVVLPRRPGRDRGDIIGPDPPSGGPSAQARIRAFCTLNSSSVRMP